MCNLKRKAGARRLVARGSCACCREEGVGKAREERAVLMVWWCGDAVLLMDDRQHVEGRRAVASAGFLLCLMRHKRRDRD